MEDWTLLCTTVNAEGIYTLAKKLLKPGLPAAVNLLFYCLQPFERVTVLINIRHMLMFHFLFHFLLNPV